MSERPQGKLTDIGNRWCWRCFRFTRHYGTEDGRAVCVRCALLRDGAEKTKTIKKKGYTSGRHVWMSIGSPTRIRT